MRTILLTLLLSLSLFANETCSRVAVVNYQEILVDAGSSKKGEGLRYYLEKDPISKKLLDQYQEKNKPTKWGAATSTMGSFLMLGGLLQTNDADGFFNRDSMLYSGAILIAISYLTSKTLQYNNEDYLKQAIDQYNKRNNPKIFFSPYADQKSSGIGIGVSKGF
jgi:hypothetical protein